VNEITKYEQDLSRLPEDQTRLVRLERQRQLHERMYNDVAAKQVELRLYEQSSTGNGRVFDHARLPSSPFYPDHIYFLGHRCLFLGIATLGGTPCCFWSSPTRKIDSIDAMKSYDLPFMSVIPDIRPTIKKEFKGMQFL
jgi:hypothetical protein